MIATTLLCTGLLLIIISGVAKGAQDILSHGKYKISILSKFKNKAYWDPQGSWRNKYKERGDTLIKDIIEELDDSVLVTFTDGWHTVQLFNYRCLQIGMALLGAATMYLILTDDNLWAISLPIAGMVLQSMIFHISYHYILLLPSKRKVDKE